MSAVLRVDRRTAGTVAVLELHGDVNADGEELIKERYGEASSDGSQHVLFELSNAEYINTAGISVLIGIVMTAKKAGRTILVSGATPHYRKVFDLVRFSSFVAMFDTEAEALTSVGGPTG